MSNKAQRLAEHTESSHIAGMPTEVVRHKSYYQILFSDVPDNWILGGACLACAHKGPVNRWAVERRWGKDSRLRHVHHKLRWYVTLKKRAVERHEDGRKKQGVGTNEFIGAGIDMKDAIANLIDNAERMAAELRMIASPPVAIEPNTDAATAKEQPIKVADNNDDAIKRVRHLLVTHGNSAIVLSTLIHSGVITVEEARAAGGLPPLSKAA